MAINTSIVTNKATSIISENFKPSYSIPANAITPATLTAMAGLAQGGALQIAPTVTSAINSMRSAALSSAASIPEFRAALASAGVSNVTTLNTAVASITSNANISPAIKTSVTSLAAPGGLLYESIDAADQLATLSTKLVPPGNPAAFGQTLLAAQAHINDSLDMQAATSFAANMSFGDYGDGVTNMSSMVTRGIDTKFGDLTAAAAAMSAAGPAADLNDIYNLGTDVGTVNKISTLKLGKDSNVLTDALKKAGIDEDNLSNPAYASTVTRTLKSVNDPSFLSAVTAQMGIKPAQPITSLADLSDLKKITPAGTSTAGLTANLKEMGTKLGDLGAKFANPEAAAKLFKSIEIPKIPSLNSAATSMKSLMDSISPTIKNMTGSGSGPLGVPSMNEFVQAASGGPIISNILAKGVTADSVAKIKSMVAGATSMISKAGIDLDNPAPNNLSSVMALGASLHKIGADVSGSGIAKALKAMATNDKFGDAIKASLAEGKNNALMAVNGIMPNVNSPITPPPPSSSRGAELEQEYQDNADLVETAEDIDTKKYYAKSLRDDILPELVGYYESLGDTDKAEEARTRLAQWTSIADTLG